MDLFPLLMQQLKALLIKNFLQSWRNKISTFGQLLSPCVFLFLLLAVTKWSGTSKTGDAVDDLIVHTSPSIPPCDSMYYSASPCYDFVWSGNYSVRVTSIVHQIMAKNPGRPIPPQKVKSFEREEDVDEWLYNNPMQCPGALHFAERGNKTISYGIQTNSSLFDKRGLYEDTTMKFQIPLQIAAEREIARSFIEDPNFIWMVNLKEFAHPAKYDLEKTTFFVTTAAHLLLAITVLRSVFQICSLGVEKQLKLRQEMAVMGLYDTAYWLSWLIWEATFGFVLSLITVFCGRMFQFPLFLNNSFMMIFLVFFLFKLSMIGFSFMLASVIWKPLPSIIVGLIILPASYLTQNISMMFLHFPYRPNTQVSTYQIFSSLFPPNLFSKSFQILHVAAGQGGFSWSKRSQCFELESFLDYQTNCSLTMIGVFKLHIALFFFWFLMAIYFDNVIPNSSGVRKPILYFLSPGYWTGEGGEGKEGGILSCLYSIPQAEHKSPNDEDVLEEENAVKRYTTGRVGANVAVQLRGLMKTYAARLEIGWWKCSKKSHIHAVKGLWVNIPKDEVFCFLGPKGAGKTTVISCLTGISPATSGDAQIFGRSIRSSHGMSNARKLIGVCPQFDVLWDRLSGEEHLNLVAGIKGIPRCFIRSAVQKALAVVKLRHAAKGRASAYDCGMKRRLGIAMALVGDPELVILDEPTTGMDPFTRRRIWGIIEEAKKIGRTIILTTALVEEADFLADRIGIVAKGMLRSIGSPGRLRSKLGFGSVAALRFSETNLGANSCRDALKFFFKERLNVVPEVETAYFMRFVLPSKRKNFVRGVLAELDGRRREFGILELQVGPRSLKEVYVNVAKAAALEDAEVEDNRVPLELKSGTTLMIPMGAERIGIPGSASAQSQNLRGLMVKVCWGLDSDGNLCIIDQSAETPIPVSETGDFNLSSMLPNGDPPHGINLDSKAVAAAKYHL